MNKNSKFNIDERLIELLLQQIDLGKAVKQALIDKVKAKSKEIALLQAQNYEFNASNEALLEETEARIGMLTTII